MFLPNNRWFLMITRTTMNWAKILMFWKTGRDTLKSQKKLLIFRFESTDNIIVPMTLWKSAGFYAKERDAQIFYGIFYGFLLITLLYNFFIYFSVRQKSYLYYVCFVGSFGLFHASFTGL